ncbi:MAG: DsbA family protein [Hyphomonadaceae bacterium]|jgi:protein-disulfide isomerase
MNRRMLILVIAAVALLVFAGAAAFYLNRDGSEPASRLEAPPIESIETPTQSTTPQPPAEAVPAPAETTAGPATPAPRWTVYVRQHSPVIGPASARVTIVEFFDPACEACRAFYPVVHEILRRHPNDVRLVLRYTPLHEGSEEAVRILETARTQGVFEPVLTSLFREQPRWAAHGSPQIALAWQAAQAEGLDVDAARRAMNGQHINRALRQDIADARTLGVRGTPTFFVNEQPLANFSPQGLYELVLSELGSTSPR